MGRLTMRIVGKFNIYFNMLPDKIKMNFEYELLSTTKLICIL